MYAELIRIKCSACKTDKLENEFHNWKHERRCKPCISSIRKADYKLNPEKQRQRANEYRKNNPDKVKNTKLMQSVGVGLDVFHKLSKDQKHVCGICKRAERNTWKGKISHLAVDHCHKTNNIRGLLCANCNRAIGLLEDRIDLIRAAEKYLKKYQK